jgi:hypothetical protein
MCPRKPAVAGVAPQTDLWLPTLERAGIRAPGHYNIWDTFITLALSVGEDPGWVAQVCGTSEEMIFRHYRRWIPGLQPNVRRKIGRLLDRAAGGTNRPVRDGGGRESSSTAELSRDYVPSSTASNL